jgi:outer membrane protein assembly factor BamB
MRRWITVVPFLAAFALLAACSKDKEIDKPAALVPFSATLKVDKVWSAGIGDKKGVVLRLGLGIGRDGARVYAAGRKGDVAAYDFNTGHQIWRVRTKTLLSGGTGVGDNLVVVGSNHGDLIALNAKNGATLWKIKVNGEVLAPPAISERLIVLRTVDGKLHGLAPADGRELWVQEQQVPRLSLRGTATPVLKGDLALCGFDNGKVVAVNINDGSVQWETTVSSPHGRTELDRLVDIDSTVDVSGNDVYAVGFQGRVAMLALDTGQVWWAHDASSYHGLGIDDDALYVGTADGTVISMRKRTGAEIWRQSALSFRRLGSVAVSDNAVIVGDYKGYVHWLDKATGALAARAGTGKVRITQPPIVSGNMVLVINDAGTITAFRTTPIAGGKPLAAPKAAKAPATTAPAAEKDNVAAPSTPADPSPAPDQGAAPAKPQEQN